MKHCVFISTDDLGHSPCYDPLAIPHLAALGWQVETRSWRDQQVDWNHYDIAVIRSPWDYQDDAESFLATLNKIEQSRALLLNDLATVSWNINKRYLRDLADKGVAIIPTLWLDGFDLAAITAAFSQFNTDELVLKPNVSAGSYDTFRLDLASLHAKQTQLAQMFAQRQLMVQPFLPDIVSHGEYSLFFFNNELSHTIVKTPKAGDFRVQEEYGGQLKLIQPSAALLAAAQNAVNCVTNQPLYVRVDMASYQDQLVLMELELIEPSLYFNVDPDAAKRFAQAIEQRYNSK